MSLGFTQNAVSQLKTDELKKRLLDCVNDEKQMALKTANAFYQQGARNEQQCVESLDEVIAIVDRVLAAGDWEESLFLRNSVKPLKKMRDEAIALKEQLVGEKNEIQIATPAIKENMQAIYVSLFQNGGDSIKKWEMQLRSIDRYLLGRPVYLSEENVRKMIRRKLVQTSEAFLVMAVNQAHIIDDGFIAPRVDRNESPLAKIAEGGLKAENIIEFVHQDNRYHFLNGRLILKK